jgi:hypothetical protein
MALKKTLIILCMSSLFSGCTTLETTDTYILDDKKLPTTKNQAELQQLFLNQDWVMAKEHGIRLSINSQQKLQYLLMTVQDTGKVIKPKTRGHPAI